MRRFRYAAIGLVLLGVMGISSSSWRPHLSPNFAWAAEYRVVDYEAVTVTNTATGFTVAKYYTAATNTILADYVICVLETAQVRYLLTGTAPEAAVGVPLEVGQALVLDSYDQIQKAKFIRTGATSGKLHVHYLKLYK